MISWALSMTAEKNQIQPLHVTGEETEPGKAMLPAKGPTIDTETEPSLPTAYIHPDQNWEANVGDSSADGTRAMGLVPPITTPVCNQLALQQDSV